MSVVIFGVPCQICGKAITPAVDEALGNDDLRGHVCETCQADLLAIRDKFIQRINAGPTTEATECGECHGDFDAVAVLTGQRSMYLHVVNGTMVLLCKTCSEAHDQKALTGSSLRGRNKHLDKREFAALQRKVGRG